MVWKSIESLGRLGVIVRALNNCRAIVILRHPCGYAASMLRGQHASKFKGFDSDYEMLDMLLATEQAKRRGIRSDDLREMHPLERLTLPWLLLNEKAMDDTENDDNCKLLIYEELCADPVKVARELFDFARLEWNGQSEEFVRNSVSRESATYYGVYKNPLEAANKWTKQLAASDIDKILAMVDGSQPGKYYM